MGDSCCKPQDSCGTQMTPEQIKQVVRDHYGAAIEGGSGSTSACCAKQDTTTVGGARTSFGCGDPLAMLGLAPGQNVLDLGSGPGLDAIEAARRVLPGGSVIGVEMTGPMIAAAERNAKALGVDNVEFRAGDAEHLPVADATIDHVISNCVVNLVPDKKKVFSEIYRVLKPGGSFSITDLVSENLPPEILASAASLCACIGGAPSEKAYLEAISSAGFAAIDIADRFRWDAPELEGTGGIVWSLKITAHKPQAAGA